MHAKERGFSLVELLVAMAVGLLLTLLVANLFVGSRNTNTATDEVSRMQESIRFAYQMLTRSIRHAGYRSDPSSDPTLVFTGANLAVTGTEGSGVNPDTLTVSFQGSGTGAGLSDLSVMDCLGRPFDQNVTVVNTFFIQNGANGAPALWCTSNAGGVATAEVVPDVDNMQVLYGEDTDADVIPNRFVPITQVLNLNNIIAVRVALLFSTNNPAGTSSGRTDIDTAQYDLNGTTVGPFNDRQFRRVVVWNVNLRNRSPY